MNVHRPASMLKLGGCHEAALARMSRTLFSPWRKPWAPKMITVKEHSWGTQAVRIRLFGTGLAGPLRRVRSISYHSRLRPEGHLGHRSLTRGRDLCMLEIWRPGAVTGRPFSMLFSETGILPGDLENRAPVLLTHAIRDGSFHLPLDDFSDLKIDANGAGSLEINKTSFRPPNIAQPAFAGEIAPRSLPAYIFSRPDAPSLPRESL